jgi:hypothetical protein
MADHPVDTYYVPLLMTVASVLAGVAVPALEIHISHSAATALNALSVILFLTAGVLAYRTMKGNATRRGGRGGRASVIGDNSTAQGGQGGNSTGGTGGTGGNATVRGNNSVARGGDGGTG